MATRYERTRRLWIVGDSIGDRGWALGNHADLISNAHALYGFSSPWRMMSLVFAENGLNIRADRFSIGSITQANLQTDLTNFVSSASVGDRDFIVIEDAGEHNENPTTFQSTLSSILGAIKAARPTLTLRVCNTADFSPAPANSQWDRTISGSTMNTAYAGACSAQGVTLVDINAIIDAYRTSMAASSVEVIHPDGIHLNVWGQMKFAGAILSSLGLAPLITARTSLTSIVANAPTADWQSLRYGSSLSNAQLQDLCVAILG